MTSLSSLETKPLSLLDEFSLPRPHDLHLHLRSGQRMQSVVLYSACVFQSAIVMPNLLPPICTVSQANAYRREILSMIESEVKRTRELLHEVVAKAGNTAESVDKTSIDPSFTALALERAKTFQPLFALFLDGKTTAEEIKLAKASEGIIGYKLYPEGATTNSSGGVADITSLYKLFAVMEENDLPLLIHGEALFDADKGNTAVDVFDRERIFVERDLQAIVKHFPALRITLEHVSSAESCDYVEEAKNVVASITVHHLMANRNAMLADGIKPHFYCKPILKTEADRRRLLAAALRGSSSFFLGTDSAPHAISEKENCCGAAGVFSSPYAMPMLVQIFADHGGNLKDLAAFTSGNGAAHYRLPASDETLTLQKLDSDAEDREKIIDDERSAVSNPTKTSGLAQDGSFAFSETRNIAYGDEQVAAFSLKNLKYRVK